MNMSEANNGKGGQSYVYTILHVVQIRFQSS